MASAEADDSRVASVIACNTVMLALASIGVCGRVTAQIYMHRFDPDDAFFLSSWVFAFVLCFTEMWMTRYGYGRHFVLIQDDTEIVAMFLKLNFVTAIAYLLSLMTIKISFCLLYLKVFSITHLRWIYYLVIGFVVCEFIEELFVVVFQCWPVNKYFYPATIPGSCRDLYVFYYVSFAIKLVTDIVLFLLPIPQLVKLHAPIGIKTGLIVMFALGLLVCVTSIVRIVYIRHFHVDYTWELVHASNWSSVEVCTAILIAAIPSLRKVLVLAYPSMRRIFHLPRSSERPESNNSTHVRSVEQGYFGTTVAPRPATTSPDCFPLPSPGLPEQSRLEMASLTRGVGSIATTAVASRPEERKQ
ncbi:hypothetical protein BJY00DRAFT_320202 [Aspergillus carlsbadensis]|nr:hypothetical protein BJY00DRAFT_320202 [Aspergillus carlsbadensis]